MDVAQEARLRRWAEYCRHPQRRLKPREDLSFLQSIRARFGPRVEHLSDDLLKMLHALWRDAQLHGAGGVCDVCGTQDGVSIVESMTAYHTEEGEPDRNHPIPLCSECADEYREHWQAMWDEYHASQGF